MTILGLLVRLDTIGAIGVFSAIALVVVQEIPADLAALVIVACLKLNENLYWTCRAIADLELGMK